MAQTDQQFPSVSSQKKGVKVNAAEITTPSRRGCLGGVRYCPKAEYATAVANKVLCHEPVPDEQHDGCSSDHINKVCKPVWFYPAEGAVGAVQCVWPGIQISCDKANDGSDNYDRNKGWHVSLPHISSADLIQITKRIDSKSTGFGIDAAQPKSPAVITRLRTLAKNPPLPANRCIPTVIRALRHSATFAVETAAQSGGSFGFSVYRGHIRSRNGLILALKSHDQAPISAAFGGANPGEFKCLCAWAPRFAG